MEPANGKGMVSMRKHSQKKGFSAGPFQSTELFFNSKFSYGKVTVINLNRNIGNTGSKGSPCHCWELQPSDHRAPKPP